MARVITVGFDAPFQPLVDMSYIRWFSIASELARLGHEVDIATADRHPWWSSGVVRLAPRLRRVPLRHVRWERYDVVKTQYQRGFETFERYGGLGHGCVIARMSGVVDAVDREGIYFQGERRRWLFSVQEKIRAHSAAVSLTTPPAMQLWQERFPGHALLLLVPGAAASEIPAPGPSPYPAGPKYRCLFAGNLFDTVSQRAVNEHLTRALNTLGERLLPYEIQLFAIGSGDTTRLDPRFVTHLGRIPYARSWDYLYHASAGLALQWGPCANQNELTKIYYYLRAGLPVICQSGFPNQHLVDETGLGFVVANGNIDELVDRTREAVRRTDWHRHEAAGWIAKHHTWRNRAELYHRFLSERAWHSKSAPARPMFAPH